MKKVKIAQIGISDTTHAGHIYRTLKKLDDVFEIVGLADVNFHHCPLEPIFDQKKIMPLEELWNIPGLEAVVVDCDEVLLTKYAIMAAERGFAIQFEKPGSESDADFDRLIDLVEKNRTIFHTSYMYRYNPAVQYAMEKIRAGKIGKVFSVEAQMNCYHGAAFRDFYQTMPHGMMYYLGCHVVDLVYQIMGEPEEVIPLSASTYGAGYDFGMAAFKYQNGMAFAKTCSAEVDGWRRRSVVICGDQGTIEISPLESPLRGDLDTATVREAYLNQNTVTETKFLSYDRYESMLRSFAAMVRGEKENPFSYEYERKLHKLLLRACGKKGIS